MNILENRLPINSITVMIQKEVAYRMEAKPGTKDYGALSVIVQYFSKPYLVANVPRNCFMPRPNVDSAVIRLDILNKHPVDVYNLELFYYIITKPYLVANVPRNCFMPRPNVDSAVIRLDILNKHPVDVYNLELFYYIIKVAFSQRRKTLLNCIFNAENFKFDKEKIGQILEEAGFDINIRGERLTIEDFANLTKTIEKYL